MTHATPDGTLIAVTHAYGKYVPYVPFYAFSLLTAYPDYYLRVFVDGDLPPAVALSLALLSDSGYDRFEVIEAAERYLPPNGFRTAARFLIGPEHFAGFRYGLTADIDHLFVREDPPLHEQELERCRLIGKPYANVVRTAPGYRRKMAGWHFFEVEPYFEAMAPILASYRDDPWGCEPVADPEDCLYCYDESLLYRMVKYGLGVLEWDEPRPYDFVLEHGFHLGMNRVDLPYPEWWRANASWCAQGLVLFDDPVFRGLRRFTTPFVDAQLQALKIFLAGGSASHLG